MAQSIRLPTTILSAHGYHTARILLGDGLAAADVVLDTGSGMLLVKGAALDPVASGCTTTSLLQQAQYASGDSAVCAVVTGAVALGDGASIELAAANIGVVYEGKPDLGTAAGIWGLAYPAKDTALRMPADTWLTKYASTDLGAGAPSQITPLFDQLIAAGLSAPKFAFRLNRALQRQATADPASDPLNAGLFVVGGGMECADLHNGPFSPIAVTHETFYNVNLLSVQVGLAAPIPVQSPFSSTAVSTAFVDSGMQNLQLDQSLFEAVVTALRALNPAFANALDQSGPGGADQQALNLTAWPDLVFTFEAADGGETSVTIPPTAYWQEDAAGKGRAVPMLTGDQGLFGGQSVLGLPLFVGKYVVFDRSVPGKGVVAVAPAA
jgi:hypothetical protein